MHRIEALARQRGKGESPPIDRKSPYFGHMRLLEGGRRRDVLIGQRGYVEPGGGVQIVDWRNAPVSRLFYRYEEGDSYEEQLGDRVVEGEVLVAADGGHRRRRAAPGDLARRRPSRATCAPAPGARSTSARPACRWRATGRSRSTASSRPPPARRADQGDRPRPPGPRRRADAGSIASCPAIAALIDPRQFELITRPTSGLIVVQGSAGSGKTTIGLHRIAYLAFADPRRFRPERMLVVVYQRALATYVSRVLPSLDVAGVPVTTFAAWAEQVRRAVFPELDVETTDATPSVVVRAKSHGAMLKILEDRQAELAAFCRARDRAGAGRPARRRRRRWRPGTPAPGPVDLRVTRAGPLGEGRAPVAAGAGGHRGDGQPAALAHARRAGRVGRAAHRSGGAGRRASSGTRPGCSAPGQLDELARWCSERERLRENGPEDEDGERYALDVEDDALLLRIYQLQRGPLQTAKGPLAYEHLMVDEVQDFAPVELAVLLDSTTKERSITLAGDTAQAIAPDHGFTTWSEMLDHLGIAHDRVEPLRVSYRSTREIVEVAQHVLGPLQGDVRPVAPRSGAPVESFGFASVGRGQRVPAPGAQGADARRAGRGGGAHRPPPRAGPASTTRR